MARLMSCDSYQGLELKLLSCDTEEMLVPTSARPCREFWERVCCRNSVYGRVETYPKPRRLHSLQLTWRKDQAFQRRTGQHFIRDLLGWLFNNTWQLSSASTCDSVVYLKCLEYTASMLADARSRCKWRCTQSLAGRSLLPNKQPIVGSRFTSEQNGDDYLS